MTRYTREEFEVTFKASIAKLINLSVFLTPARRIEVMRHPNASIVTFEYSTKSDGKRHDLITCVEVQWWIGPDGHIKGKALAITIFDTQDELKKHRSAAIKRMKPDFTQN